MEKYVEVTPVGVVYICDVCNSGKVVYTSDMKMYHNYATFVHRCEKCDSKIELLEKYPLIRYEGV